MCSPFFIELYNLPGRPERDSAKLKFIVQLVIDGITGISDMRLHNCNYNYIYSFVNGITDVVNNGISDIIFYNLIRMIVDDITDVVDNGISDFIFYEIIRITYAIINGIGDVIGNPLQTYPLPLKPSLQTQSYEFSSMIFPCGTQLALLSQLWYSQESIGLQIFPDP